MSDCKVVTSLVMLVMLPPADVTRVVRPDIAVAFVVMSVCAVEISDSAVLRLDCNVVTSLDNEVIELP